VLVYLGNPGNMGVCGACFLRDVTGALGMIVGPRIFRPEVAGVMLARSRGSSRRTATARAPAASP